MTWPAEPVVARAYLDQLERSNGLSGSTAADLGAALDSAASTLARDERDRNLAGRFEEFAKSLNKEESGDAATVKRRAALAETLGGIAARLR